MNPAEVGGVRIEDGDLVLVRQQLVAESGQIVVALIDGEATVKRLERGPGYYLLKPESSDRSHKSIIVHDDFSLVGVGCLILKRGSRLLELNE